MANAGTSMNISYLISAASPSYTEIDGDNVGCSDEIDAEVIDIHDSPLTLATVQDSAIDNVYFSSPDSLSLSIPSILAVVEA